MSELHTCGCLFLYWQCSESLLWHPHSLKWNDKYAWTHSFHGPRECMLVHLTSVVYDLTRQCLLIIRVWVLNSHDVNMSSSNNYTKLHDSDSPSSLNHHQTSSLAVKFRYSSIYWIIPRNLHMTLSGRKRVSVVMIMGKWPKDLEIGRCVLDTTSGCVVDITSVLLDIVLWLTASRRGRSTGSG